MSQVLGVNWVYTLAVIIAILTIFFIVFISRRKRKPFGCGITLLMCFIGIILASIGGNMWGAADRDPSGLSAYVDTNSAIVATVLLGIGVTLAVIYFIGCIITIIIDHWEI